jgi:hypothetical protein
LTFICVAAIIFLSGIPVLAFLNLKYYKDNVEKKLIIKEYGMILYGLIYIFLEMGFFFGSTHRSSQLKIVSIIVIFFHPFCLFIGFNILIIVKKGSMAKLNFLIIRILICLPFSILFTILSLVNLIGNSFELINNFVTYIADLKFENKFNKMLAKLIIITSFLSLKCLPEMIIQILIVVSSEQDTFLNLFVIVLSSLGSIPMVLLSYHEWLEYFKNKGKVQEVPVVKTSRTNVENMNHDDIVKYQQTEKIAINKLNGNNIEVIDTENLNLKDVKNEQAEKKEEINIYGFNPEVIHFQRNSDKFLFINEKN